MKKLLLGLGAMTAVAAPVVVAVSCGGDDQGSAGELTVGKVTVKWSGKTLTSVVVDAAGMTEDEVVDAAVEAIASIGAIPKPTTPEGQPAFVKNMFEVLVVEHNDVVAASLDAYKDMSLQGIESWIVATGDQFDELVQPEAEKPSNTVHQALTIPGATATFTVNIVDGHFVNISVNADATASQIMDTMNILIGIMNGFDQGIAGNDQSIIDQAELAILSTANINGDLIVKELRNAFVSVRSTSSYQNLLDDASKAKVLASRP